MLGKAKKAFTPITMGIVLTIMVGAAPAAAATKRPLLHATYSKLCTVAEQLKATPKRASKLLGSLTQAADVATQMAVKFRIGAAADPKAHKTATALAVTSILEKKAEALLQSLKTEAAKAVRAATTTTALRARIAEGLQTFAAAKVNAGYCLDSQATNSDGHTAFATSACLKDDLQVEAADEKWPAGKLKTDGFTDGPTANTPVSGDSSSNTKCALTDTGNTAGTHCFPENAKLIAATLTLNAGPSSTMRDLTQNLQQSNRQDNKLIEAALEDANLLDAADVTQYEADPEKAFKKL
uniref:Variant surface glycoprotein 1125.1533 n=1 Tax=Trypanosoma brucei TaxID=5691 RepID=A0A1J0R7C8_9TRYP|nr:variant surface glycoprotein 1125.1533 [Trypanosoma brucei]